MPAFADRCERLRSTTRVLAALAVLIGLAAPARASTVAYYRFEDGAANTAASTIDDAAGTVDGAATGGPLFRSSVFGATVPRTLAANATSLELDGTDVVSFATPFLFNTPGDATLELWIKPTGGHSILWTRSNSTDTNYFQLHVTSGNVIGFNYREPGGALHDLFSGIVVSTTQWTHLAVVRSGNDYTFYRDGASQGTVTDAVPALPDDTSWTIAGRAGAGYVGGIDELRLSNVALAPSQFLNAAPDPVPEPASTAALALLGSAAVLRVRRARGRSPAC